MIEDLINLAFLMVGCFACVAALVVTVIGPSALIGALAAGAL